MTKIAYNACFGGFSLSREAVLLGRRLTGENWCPCSIKGDLYEDGLPVEYDYGGGRGMTRTDPILIQVIEELGPAASGEFAKLAIAEVPSGTRYRIDEYDGNERVMTVQDYQWEVA